MYIKNWIILLLSATLVFVSYHLFVGGNIYYVPSEIPHDSKIGKVSSEKNQIAQATAQTLADKVVDTVEPTQVASRVDILEDISLFNSVHNSK